MSTSSNKIPSYPLGKNGALVSQLGFGAMGLTSFYTTNPISEAESLEVLAHCYKRGCRFFDSAFIYGFGANERLLGKFLKTVPRDQVFVATKFGFDFKDGKVVVDSSPDRVRRACEQSLKDLEVDYIDLYYQHRVDPNTPIEKTMEVLVELKNAGKIRHIGLSEASANTIRKAHAIHPIAAVQVEYSLSTRDIEKNGILDTCRELGIAIVAYSPLGRGFLSGTIKKTDDLDKNDWRRTTPRLQEANLEANLQAVKKIEEIAAKKNCTPSQIALAWVLSKGNDIFPIPGTRRIKYLDENINSFDVSLTPEEVKELEAQTFVGDRYSEEGMKLVNL